MVPHGSRLGFISYFSSDRTALLVSFKDKTLVDAKAACGFLPRSLRPDGIQGEIQKVSDLGRTTVLKWELGLCPGLAGSTTDAELGLKAKK